MDDMPVELTYESLLKALEWLDTLPPLKPIPTEQWLGRPLTDKEAEFFSRVYPIG